MGKILRCTGLTLLVLGCIALIPATAQAQTPLHGAGIQKACNPVDCFDDSQCQDTQFCTGPGTCPTAGPAPFVDCTIRVTNIDDFGDSLTIKSACDQIKPDDITPPSPDCTIAITFVQDNAPTGDTTCAIGDVLGDILGGTPASCILGPDDFIEFASDNYQLQLGDPTPVPDQATSIYSDLCVPGGGGCSTGNSTLQARAQTDSNSNCVEGPPTNCDDGLVCTTNDRCDPLANGGLGECAFDQVVCTDDGNACTAPLACVEPNGTPGGCQPTGLDTVCPGDFCQAQTCNTTSGLCENSGAPTDCSDGLSCTTDLCVVATSSCTHTPDNTVCDDLNICTDDVCVPTEDPVTNPTGCVNTVDNTNDSSCQGDEICRTPGFWGTHAGTEKEGHSTDITGTLLTAFNFVNEPDLQVCGATITDSADAMQAICVSPKGNSDLQLARQLTAAALNCIISNGGSGEECTPFADTAGAPCGGNSIEDVWNACNAICDGDATTPVTASVDPDGAGPLEAIEVNCIGLLDCFNNGFVINPTTLECGAPELSGCHERDLDNGCAGLSFVPPGAAGSPSACNTARKDCTSIFGPIPGCTP